MLLHQQIELQAARTPDAVAVRYAGNSLTYAELDQHANRCARYLRELGAGPDVIIGLLMERSLEMMVALLGILKAGGAYLPLDPGYPAARLDFVLDDAGVPVVITQPGLADNLGRFAGTVLSLDLGNDVLAEYDGAPLDRVNEPDDLAYVIYTSGSTGQPKGCMLTHRAICNRLIWMQDMYRLSGRDRVLQKTPYTFDVSVWEFFWPLVAGATLVFAKPQGHKDSCYLTTTIRQEGITVCHFVPSMLRFFLDDPQTPQCTSLRDVFTSGEALPFELVRRFKELLPARLHNLYGPTEAAVDVSYWECEIRPDKIVPIGRPITNILLHVLDESRRPVPRGQEGELYIAGVGLARGYLNRPQLTDERFVPNPFGEPGSRMYRTGDRVRELDDGNIDFLGRMDFQVKLRGLRIELGEIEATLRDFPGVTEAAVLVRGEEDGDPKLVAYLEMTGAAPDFREVRDFIRQRLPEYMVPNIVAMLDKLPVTSHGKLDRKALPWPVASGVQSAAERAEAPAAAAKVDVAAEVRQTIADFVASLLNTDQVEDEADLFDLGATSLTLVRVVEWIRQEYGIEVPVDVFLEAPSIRGIVGYVVGQGVADAAPAVALPPTQAPAAAAGQAPKASADAGQLTSHIRDFIASVLRCDTPADDDDLFDLGATSLSLVRVVEWIREEYGVEVPVDVFLDAPSVRGIVGYLVGRGVAEPAAAISAKAATDARAAVGSGAEATASTPATAEPLIALPAAAIRPAAYLPPLPERFTAKPIDFAAFRAWLMLLGAEEKDGRHRYLHPSGGGLNAVRTYVAVKPGAVADLAGGVYYFHPVTHSLHRVGDVAGLSRTAFCEFDRAAFDSAALAVFFVAALDAIVPLYQEHAGTLVSVDSGYMAQLLISRQAAYGLETRPVARVDFDAMQAAFGLGESERFVHCLLVGAAAPAADRKGATDLLAELKRNAPLGAGGAILNHRAIKEAPAQAPLSKELMNQLHDEHRHLRDVSGLPAACRLDTGPFAWDDYRLRACQREYESAVLPLQALGGLLTLCKPQPDAVGTYLFGSPVGRPGFQLHLYVRGGRIEGLAEGTYRYDEGRHALVQCSDLTDAAMAQAYSPYNRKHYKSSAFCLFIVARPYAGLVENEAIHLPLLESGYLGQLLMDRQAEFGLGLCPIGAIRFEVVRDSLHLPEDAVLLHSFTGGMFHQAIPAGRQTLVEPARPAVVRHDRPSDLAIIGLSGRYPGAGALDAYWENLKAGVSSVAPMPPERLALLAQDEVPAIRAGGYLAQIDCFDSLLFGISPVEARALDPQERLLLESVWACLEDAGYTAEALVRQSPRIGVFVGAMWNDYQSHGVQVWENQGRVEEASHHASLANRISYLFNFSGPSVAINTSCSSGMTALHFACESIRRGECDVALVGGVNLVSHAYHARLLETLDLLSKEDACRPFSAQANGWILGEGVGTVLIKRVDAAVRDRDHVYALIKGSAIGHSGRTMRYGAPSAQQQESNIRRTLDNAGLAPDDIDYVEAAAPGAGMADAAEMSAVKAVFAGRKAEAPCLVGTVKANVGHLESASVFSQLTKVLYQLRHRQLAPSLNSRPRNPLIALDGAGLSIVEKLTSWTPATAGRPLRALINAVGAAGSEGHLVLEEYLAGVGGPEPAGPTIVPLSATTAAQLTRQAKQLLDFLDRAPEIRLADLALTLWVGRAAMAERLAFVVQNLAALRDALAGYLAADGAGAAPHPDCWRGRAERGAEAAPANADLRELAQCWVRGGKVDWDALPASDARRISLPTYPFEPVRHWIGRTGGTATSRLPEADQRLGDVQLDGQQQEKILAHLSRLVAGVTEVPAARLDADAPLEGYGLTSLMIQKMNGKLEEDFGPLSKTLFFEVRTLRQLAEYFAEHHREAVGRLFGVAQAVPARTLQVEFRRSARVQEAPQAGEGIAIVGLSGRYPKANSLREFWANLSQGVDCISEIPLERWDHGRYFDSARGKPGKTYSKWGGFIDGVDEFDPMFFGMTPREAALVDPQERLFLQTAWHAVEDAGYTRESLRTALACRVGVFVGAMYGEYQLYPSLPDGLALSGSYSTIANRVSYVLDLRGPSMAIDTMCSSSLTAIHLACESIRRGECAAAIAGGVCLSLHPNKYVTHALLGMSASDGRCRSFGEGGDGFVPGEGVGAVLLKPLSQAIADGDHIYGVIKGTAVNHGGRTNGFTAPDPRAHAELIRTALANAGVEPRTVSYIEAHGTGTALGDPIEIAGLKQAFGELPGAAPYCAIGSAKSNIGHCESAAGIAGLTKVLLQMQHRTLVKSLHSQALNSSIDFSRTPFAVQTETAPWARPVVQLDDGPREFPRIAGISSFGAGGANAHIVVEEYAAPARAAKPVTTERPAAVVLSAKTAEALREQASRLRDAIAVGELIDERLADAAYTLQIGREAMDFRLACLADSATALKDKLDAWLGDKREVDGLLLGEVKRGTDTLAAFTADEDMVKAIDAWIAKGKLAKLLDLWVKGLAFDWNRLYAQGDEPRLQRFSLPAYPFARERYWVEAPAGAMRATAAGSVDVLHPLVHRNTSDLREQRFSTRLTGEEFFLNDHVVQGRRVLPGVAYLEMAREAVLQAAGIEPGSGVRLRDVVWASPVVIDTGPMDVHISLYPLADEAIGFEVYSGDELVHSQGSAETFAVEESERLDLTALRGQCGLASLDAADCYAGYAALGLAYGPAHQAIEAILVGDGQALAKLRLPASVAATGADYVLHPSLLDAGLQAVAGLAGDQLEDQLALPFAVQAVEIVGRCSPRMWALVKASGDSTAEVRKYDVTLCDDDGVVCVRIKGYAARVVEGRLGAGSVLLLQPDWHERAAAGEQPVFRQRRVVLCGVGIAAADLLERMDGASCLELPPGNDLAGEYGNAVQQLCAEAQGILQQRPTELVLLQVVVPASGARQVLAGLAGVLKTARLEQPKLIGQLIAVGEAEDAASLAAKLIENTACPQDVEIRYADGRRQVAGWQELVTAPEALVPWKAGGVYLITGGLGGLGALFAKEIARQARGATLVLTGRRELDDAGRQQIRALAAEGATVAYRAVDVADREAVRQLVLQIQAEHHGLHGIVHAAGVLRDSLLLKKTAGEVEQVLAPKAAGLVNLDEASREAELDWLICFSSTGAVLGNVGQADYAAANGFMDRFAHYRNGLAAQGLRHGRTVSVNWPLWQDGGMMIDAASVQRIEQLTGLQSLMTADGMTALYRVLGTGLGQAVVLKGVPGKVRRWLAAWAAQTVEQESQPRPLPAVDAPQLQDKAVQYFKRLLSTIFKLPTERIEANAPLERYGIDSILVVELTAELEKIFGPLSKTLLFEYQTLDALVGYFLSRHAERLAALLKPTPPAFSGGATKAGAAAETSPSAGQPALTAQPRRSRFALAQMRHERPVQPGSGANSGIAIIGVAGRYPQARDLKAFWENLRDGKDCVTEIPPERWDHSRYFDPDKSKLGTTYSKWGGFIDGVDEFDPQFFNISPREAEFTDPQERLFLQCVYAAMEDAGYTRETLGECSRNRNIGVYAGVFFEEYQLYGAQEQAKGVNVALGGSPSSIANRVSYYFNLHGPSLSVDSMCSGSLTAIHLACESLLHGKCGLAIAGGVNVTVHPNKYLLLAQGKFASSKGRCESFGEGGDGYVPAEGVGAVILKPLEQAIADGDHIYGVIRATAINHGGKTNGYTVPNPHAQGEVVSRALKESGIDPRTISYIEAHGTGTALGDPIEIAGLSKAFGEYTQDRQFCAIGSVKSNIGHCESAAGIAGITKVLLQLKHRQLAPSLHAKQLNPHIDFAATPFTVQRELGEWQRPVLEVDGRPVEMPRRAGISSFGAGGSNAHVVIEEYIAPTGRQSSLPVTADEPALVVLSARNEERLRERVQQLVAAIAANGWSDEKLAELAYTLQVGREAMDERLALLVSSMAELEARLTAYLASEDGIEDLYRGQVKRNKETMAVFAADEELLEAVAKWVERKKFAKVLDLWVKGLSFDWNTMYGERKPQRISLPTYPFARERYWLNRTAGQPLAVADTAAAGRRNVEATERLSLLAPVWRPEQPAGKRESTAGGMLIVGGTPLQQDMLRRQYSQAQIAEFVAGNSIAEIADVLAAHDPFDHLVWIAPDASSTEVTDEQVIAAQRDGVLHGFRLIKALLEAGYGRKALEWSVFTTQTQAVASEDAITPAHAGIHGLIGALAKEYPNWKVRLIDLSSVDPWPLTEALALPADPQGSSWAWRGGQWYRLQLLPTEVPSSAAAPYRQGGVYVVIGGAGGIGEAWSEHVIREHGARVIWIGRRPLDAEIQGRIDRLARLGPAPYYIAADAGNRAALQWAQDEIRQRYAAIHGVIHSALVLGDQSLANMDEARFAASLAAKVDVSVRLAQVFAGEPLDFVLFFSSLQSFARSAGQSNYAAGCTFKDAFAQRLGQLWPCPVKVMNWGWWGSVGVAAAPAYQARMKQLGLASIEPEEGWAALARLLGSRFDQLALLKTAAALPASQPAQGLSVAAPARTPAKALARTADAVLADSQLRELGVARFKQLVGGLLHMSEHQIDAAESLATYGIDSISVTQLCGLLAAVFADVNNALFFDYQTIDDLVAHFLATQRDALVTWVTADAVAQAAAEAAVPQVVEALPAVELQAEPVSMPSVPAPSAVQTVETPPTGAAGIAIVGIACRFPGADSVDAYWQMLLSGTKADNRGPARRWPEKVAESGETLPQSWGAFLDGVDRFDPGFFGIPPLHAESIDPQERLFLMSCWHALEDAGYGNDKWLAERSRTGEDVGVFVGVTSASYNLIGFEQSLAGNPQTTGLSFASIANRVSHALGLTGPSLSLDTMCSSSPVALHMACESLRRNECSMAIAGGVNLNLHPSRLEAMAQGKLICEDGESRSFGAGGKGFLAGEGVAAVVLKPLEAAQRDGDTIHAVIKGSAVGHSGSTLNYFAPSSRGQGKVIAKALESAGIAPDQVAYVEMQCVGDEATDTAEFEAVKTGYQTRQRPGAPLRLGSVKPNVGHAEAAAGMAQLIKVVLQLKHRTFAQTLPRGVINPQLNLAAANVAIQQEVEALPAASGCSTPLRAAINAFGAGGTAAHVIVESCLPSALELREDGPQLLVLSAKSRGALRRSAEALAHRLAAEPICLADVAYTLQVGRRELNHRLALVADSVEGTLTQLGGWQADFGETTVLASPAEGITPASGDPAAIQARATAGDLTGLARLWVSGVSIDWCKTLTRQGRRRVSLPGYAFDLRPCWPERGQLPATVAVTQVTLPSPAKALASSAAATLAKAAEPAAELGPGRKAGLLQSIVTPADAAAHLDEQIMSIAEHLHLTTVGILYSVLNDKGVLFEERRSADGALALYPRPAGGDPAATERLLAQLTAGAVNGAGEGIVNAAGSLMDRLVGRAMSAAGRLLERLPGGGEKAAVRMLKLLPGAEGLTAAYLLKLLAQTPFMVTDEAGVRLALPATIRSRKQLDELRSQYEISLRVLPEYQSYCELLAAILSGILDGQRPGPEQLAAASALLVDMFTAPSKLAFLNRVTADTCLAGRFAGRETISVLAVGAGGFEILSAIAAAAPPEARIEYRVVAGWSEIAKGVTGLGRERFPGVSFLSFVPMVPGALTERLGESRYDVVIVNTQDPCAQEAAGLLEKLAADARESLVFVTEPIETHGLQLILGLAGMWPQVQAKPGIPDGTALGETLVRAGYRRQAVVDPVLTVFSREAAAVDGRAPLVATGPGEAEIAAIRRFLLQTFADALDDGRTLDPKGNLADTGLPSMTWAIIFAKLRQRFGKAVEPSLFGELGNAPSVESLTRLLAEKLHVGELLPPLSPMPDVLADLVMRRLVEVGQFEVDLDHAAQLTRREFTSSRGQVFEYFECGTGPVLIFLTALAFSKSIWEDQIREFGGHYRLIFPHLPGHAGSVYTGVDFTFEDLADDLIELMDALGAGEANVVGWCMAGNIAQLLALRHPQRLKSLALVCTTPTDARMRGITQKDLEDYSVSPLLTYQMEFSNIYHEDFLAPEVARSLAIIRQAHVPVEPKALLNLISSLFQFDTRKRLHEIQVPTLVVAGSRDIAFPIDQVALLKDGIRHSRFVVFERGGHLPFLNQSNQFNAALREFLGRVSSSSKETNVAIVGHGKHEGVL